VHLSDFAEISLCSELTFNACCVGQQDLARAGKEVGDHTEFTRRVAGRHPGHVVA
jgi:hypothetical protein